MLRLLSVLRMHPLNMTLRITRGAGADGPGGPGGCGFPRLLGSRPHHIRLWSTLPRPERSAIGFPRQDRTLSRLEARHRQQNKRTSKQRCGGMCEQASQHPGIRCFEFGANSHDAPLQGERRALRGLVFLFAVPAEAFSEGFSGKTC